MGLKKESWTPEEDRILLAYIQEHGHGSWRSLPSRAGLKRCGKSCRLRWMNYLRPDIKKNTPLFNFMPFLETAIAAHLLKRTDNEIKNYWNTHLKKRLANMGIDPISHKPTNLSPNTFQSKLLANISHLAQWENARLQAEARLVRGSKLISTPYRLLSTAAAPSLPPLQPLCRRPPCLDILKVWEWTNPGKDISSVILNGFPPSQNMLPNTAVGLVHENLGSSNNCHQEGAKGKMENPFGLHRTTVDSAYVDDSLGFPNFVDDFAHIQPYVALDI